MTRLKALAINVLMLAIAVGILYWAVQPEVSSEPETSVTGPPPAAEAPSEREPESGEAPRVPQKAPSAPVREAAASRAARPAPPPASRSDRAVTFPLDLNTARLEELMVLPGIGETLAQRVVEYRRRHGRFRSVDDLRKVRGIGEKRMEQLRPLVMTAEVP
jgi:comEA protein